MTVTRIIWDDDAIATFGPIRDLVDEAADLYVDQVNQKAPTSRFGANRGPVEQDHDGPAVDVAARSAGSVAIEFGSINNPAYAPFRNAASALGLEGVK